MYETFIERTKGTKRIGDKMSKRNLHSFAALIKDVKGKIKDQVNNPRQERKSMSRLIVISRKREKSIFHIFSETMSC